MEITFITGILELKNEITLAPLVGTEKYISKKFTIFAVQVPICSFHKVMSEKR